MKEKHGQYILYGILIAVIIGLVFAFTGFSINTTRAATTSQTSDFNSINSGSTGEGDVSVELTPLEINDKKLRVKIEINTHSVDLSQFELKEITTLQYNGKSIKPVSAPILKGHHSDGELIFDLDEETDSFIIIIKGIPKVEERKFRWG